MIETLIHYRIDAVVFAVLALLACEFLLRRPRRVVTRARAVMIAWLVAAALVITGAIAAELLGDRERDRLRAMLEGFAPTYAQEMVELGLRSITLDTPPDDPAYLRLIEAQKRWQKVNRTVNDIYTFARRDDGVTVLLVDSETDYDHNGVFEGEREQRTSLGEPYASTAKLNRAFAGLAEFDEVPYTDRWGTWVSAYVPVFNRDGGVHSVTGVDFAADNWIKAIAFYRASALGFFMILVVTIVGGIAFVQMARAEVERERDIERELRRASEQAQAASHAKGSFLANMSHEIRTPMNGVLGMLELLRSTGLSNTQLQCVDTAYRSGESLLMLLNDILDYSKIEAGRMPLENVEFDLRELIEDIIDLHAIHAHGKGIDVCARVERGVPGALLGDPTRLRQILNNLISNAVKFTDRGTVTLCAENAVASDDDQLQLRFVVTDTGIGISSDKQKKLFDAFSQADDTITRRFGGTGLGLAISKRIAIAMGGGIAIASTEGAGSVFSVTARFTRAATRVPGWVPHPELSGVHALVVDDDDFSRATLVAMLSEFGARVSVANSARGAGEILDADRSVRVAILDQRVGDASGLEIAEQLRVPPLGGAPRIVLMCAGAGAIDGAQLERRGIHAVMNKPIRRRNLHDAVCAALDLPARAQGPTSMGNAASAFEPRKERLLVVEDNEVNQMVAQGFLKSLGFDPEVVNDGNQALHALANRHFDLVLMDVQMPVLDGLEATRRWRGREPEGRRLPIVAMTAGTQPSDREECLAAGMDDFISKPVRREALFAVIQRWLAHDDAAAPPAGAAQPADLAHIDIAKLTELRDILGAEFERVVRVFAAEAPRRVSEMRDALARDDRGALRRGVHSLKGSSGNVGAQHLHVLCKSLELEAERLSPAEIVPRIDAIAVEANLVIAELQRCVASAAA